MRNRSNKTCHQVAQLGVLTAALMGSTGSYACPADPFISAVCIMAVAGSQYTAGFDSYVLANGQALNTNSYQALYALIGTTYGGTTSAFNLPNLQGRVVVGAGYQAATGLNYPVGAAQDNSPAIQLTAAQLPAHFHLLNSASSPIQVAGGGVSLNFQNVNFVTSLAAVTATTTLTNVQASTDGSALQLYASHGGTTTNEPLNASLTLTSGAAAKIYSDASPYVAMKAGSTGSIRGTAPVSFVGNPTTTLAGTATTSMVGTPSASLTPFNASISGATAAAGANGPVNIMPSYIALRYFIAVSGLYPVSN
ncbi:phage tail protein [Herbaspirillum sp. RV1423]|uniref:phage tail protein n=1 Tax=Herbaspirillum sp. RV1423 TaxID=1443993 RepID=UPI0009DFBB8F|nr:tail fiber protein [Herbaspirillum sp. RV1423]